MAYIKRMVMQGFKSFARRTEVEFDKEINTIVGPNGSGKSNIGDGLSFVLGRLSIKSMRAAKAKNLIFMGSKYIKPAKEAYVELVFDNSDRVFSINSDEIILKRIVRTNGQSIYKINDEAKTRTEIIEMLAQAGIDPHGFNLVMQGQIQSIVRMHPEERRKIIEEVAGISIYELRKEKSLKELDKTEQRLKEISTILRERTAYLKNLEREKEQAERYKDNELMAKRAKASIINKKSQEKKKEVSAIIKSIGEKSSVKEDIRNKINVLQDELDKLNSNINDINKHIQKSTGVEQESLHNKIANLRAELEGLKVRNESYENREEEIGRRIKEMGKSIPELETEIKELRKQSPLMARKANELKKKREELVEIEKERKRLHTFEAEIQSLKERIKDKEKQLARTSANSESLLERIEEHSTGLQHENEEACSKSISEFKKNLSSWRNKLEEFGKKWLENEKMLTISDSDIYNANNVKLKIEKIDVCPMCQSKMTKNHIEHVNKESNEKIEEAKKSKEKALSELQVIKNQRDELGRKILEIQENISKLEIDLMKHRNVHEKKEQLKSIVNEEKILKEEISELYDKIKKSENKSSDIEGIEEKYQKKMFEIEEISSRTEEDIDTTLLYKEREKENTNNIIKRSEKDLEDIREEIDSINIRIETKSEELAELEDKDKKLQEKFKQLFESRDAMQKQIQEMNIDSSEKQQELRQIEDQVNYLKIGKAKLDAEHEGIEMELSEFVGIELIQGSIQYLEERLRKTQEALQNIGSINMRALEVYDEVKKEYDIVQGKVNILQTEKDDVMKIIGEIDKKKKKTFMKTFNAINDIFSQNFSKLSSKGNAYLEVENEENIFDGGVNIVVKLAKGKYFDVTSLSGGEQTLVALSLLFAIQEHKPYHFYVFDEIDAALDKRNSERLAGLLEQYMKSAQYIVITHNDSLINNSNLLYGVSMHEGVSKVLSLKLDEALRKEAMKESLVGEEIKSQDLVG